MSEGGEASQTVSITRRPQVVGSSPRGGGAVSLEGAHEESGEREDHPQTSPEAVSGVK